jgi:hypothetical protein
LNQNRFAKISRTFDERVEQKNVARVFFALLKADFDVKSHVTEQD